MTLALIGTAVLILLWLNYRLQQRIVLLEAFVAKQVLFNKHVVQSVETLSARIGKQDDRIDSVNATIADVADRIG